MDLDILLVDTEDMTPLFQLDSVLYNYHKPQDSDDNKYMYIVSKKPILNRDYFISMNDDESFLDVIQSDCEDFSEYADEDWTDECFKVIFTTDPKLIVDGVPEIPRDFIVEYVIKYNEGKRNASCYVDENGELKHYKTITLDIETGGLNPNSPIMFNMLDLEHDIIHESEEKHDYNNYHRETSTQDIDRIRDAFVEGAKSESAKAYWYAQFIKEI